MLFEGVFAGHIGGHGSYAVVMGAADAIARPALEIAFASSVTPEVSVAGFVGVSRCRSALSTGHCRRTLALARGGRECEVELMVGCNSRVLKFVDESAPIARMTSERVGYELVR